jgi:hypothetical protein
MAAGGLNLTGSDQSTASGTATAITGLSFTIHAGETWSFEGMLSCNTDNTNTANAGLKMSVSGPDIIEGWAYGASPSGTGNASLVDARLTAAATLVPTGNNTPFGGKNLDNFIYVFGMAHNSTSSDETIQFNFASANSSNTVKIRAGSYINSRKL